MKMLTCAATRRCLHAFHDDELAVSDQIAVGAHLEWCEGCAAALAELRTLRSLIRVSTRDRADLSGEEEQGFQCGVVSRLNAEDRVAFAARVQDMFEDMRLVYAGLGASVAAVACVLMMLNMMRFAREEQDPNSLAAVVNALASAEASQSEVSRSAPVVVDARLLLSRSSGAAFAADSDTDVDFFYANAEYALAGVVTREGRVTNLELVHASSGQPVAPGTEEAIALSRLMGVVARQRYEPARVDGLPIAVNKVWPVAAITVHATKTPLDPPVSPDAKGRVTLSHVAAANSAAV